MSDALGQVLRAGNGARLEFRRDHAVPVDDLWSAVTESDRLARWIGSWTGSPEVGGAVLFTMLHEAQECPPEPVTIVECEPPHRLVVEWPVSSESWPWRIELTLSETATGSTLSFVQPLPDPAAANDAGPGWQWYLDRLGATLREAAMPPGWEAFYTDELRQAYREITDAGSEPRAERPAR